jgi:hypothetical protein
MRQDDKRFAWKRMTFTIPFSKNADYPALVQLPNSMDFWTASSLDI